MTPVFLPMSYYLRDTSAVQSLSQGNRQLVSTGSTAAAAVVAAQHIGNLLGFCPFYQLADSLQITRTAAHKLHVVQFAGIINTKGYLLSANTLGCKGILFHYSYPRFLDGKDLSAGAAPASSTPRADNIYYNAVVPVLP
jgi:hypothetical protein